MSTNFWLILDEALTDVSGSCMLVGKLVELSGSHGVHLNEGDAPTAPLFLWLIDRQEGLEEQIGNSFADWLWVNSQASQQVVHVANVPELENGGKGERMRRKILSCNWIVPLSLGWTTPGFVPETKVSLLLLNIACQWIIWTVICYMLFLISKKTIQKPIIQHTQYTISTNLLTF